MVINMSPKKQEKDMEHEHNGRVCLRTEFSAEVELSDIITKKTLNGRMVDVSMYGMFVEADETLALNTLCQISIKIEARNSRLTLQDIEGVIVRVKDDGVGIRFTSNMEWYALFNVYSCYGKYGKID